MGKIIGGHAAVSHHNDTSNPRRRSPAEPTPSLRQPSNQSTELRDRTTTTSKPTTTPNGTQLRGGTGVGCPDRRQSGDVMWGVVSGLGSRILPMDRADGGTVDPVVVAAVRRRASEAKDSLGELTAGPSCPPSRMWMLTAV
jgi:hypothetical protein